MANTPNIVRAIGNQLGTTLNAGISSSASSITLVDATGFSTDGGYIIIDENITGKEEIVYVTSVAGSTLAVATDGRGRCGTSAVSHDSGATVSDILVDEHINGIADKFIVEHEDDGTHTADYATLTGTQELTNKTLTTPVLTLADSSPTADGGVGYDRTEEELQIGDGTNSLSARMGAWKSWTPSWNNLTVGNGTNTGWYCQIGKTVHVRVRFIFGSTSSMSNFPNVVLPVNCVTHNSLTFVGNAMFRDTGAAYHTGVAAISAATNTNLNIYPHYAAANYTTISDITSSVPFTWTNTDEISLVATYEAS